MRKVEARFGPVPEATTPLEELILRGLEAGEVGVWNWDSRSERVYWTPNLEAIHQLPPGRFDGTFNFFQNDIHPDDRETVMEKVGRAFAAGGAYTVQYRLLPQGSDEPRWLEARGHVLEEGGVPVGMTGICQDITERKRGESELERRTRQQEAIARLGQLAVSSEREGGEQALFDLATAETAAALDVEMCKILELLPGGSEFLLRAGVGWREGLVGTMRLGTDRQSQAGYTLKSDEPVVVTNLAKDSRFGAPVLLKDHDVVSGLSVVISGEDGRAYGVLGAHSRQGRRFSRLDVDFLQSVANLLASAIHRQRAIERQDLLVRELRHRVGNLLSLIASLFNNSASGARSIPDLEEKFLARLMSLARAHSMISQAGGRAACMRGLLDAVLEPYVDRLLIDGEDVGIDAESGVALSLAFHELATNAAKHGAWSSTAGNVSVSWSVRHADDQPVLVLDWTETGGPKTHPPDSRGFGSKLVKTVIERQLDGTIVADFAEAGLRVHLEFPIN